MGVWILLAGRKEAGSVSQPAKAEPPFTKKVYAKWMGKGDMNAKYFGGSVNYLAQFWPELKSSPGADVTIRVAATGEKWVARWIRRGGATGILGNGCFFSGTLSTPSPYTKDHPQQFPPPSAFLACLLLPLRCEPSSAAVSIATAYTLFFLMSESMVSATCQSLNP